MTKNILIIGNGLDLSLGLKTSYSNFLKWLKSNYSNNNGNIWINYYITYINKYKSFTWADFEIDLGKILNKDVESEIKEFWNIIKNMNDLHSIEKNKKIINDWLEFNNLFLKFLKNKILKI